MPRDRLEDESRFARGLVRGLFHVRGFLSGCISTHKCDCHRDDECDPREVGVQTEVGGVWLAEQRSVARKPLWNCSPRSIWSAGPGRRLPPLLCFPSRLCRSFAHIWKHAKKSERPAASHRCEVRKKSIEKTSLTTTDSLPRLSSEPLQPFSSSFSPNNRRKFYGR